MNLARILRRTASGRGGVSGPANVRLRCQLGPRTSAVRLSTVASASASASAFKLSIYRDRPVKPSRLFHTSTTRLNHAAQDGPDIFCDVQPVSSTTTTQPFGDNELGYIANITISNPKHLNSLTKSMVRKLGTKLRDLSQQPNIRCLIIQGNKTSSSKAKTPTPSFTSGANLYEIANLTSYEEAEEFITNLHSTCQAMRDFPVPTIAKINGLCLGGGLELAASCDFRYATRNSTFSMPETKFGIPSVIQARLLVNLIGWQKTKEMVYFAKFYTADQVEGWGLVDKSCEDGEELDCVVDEAVEIITSFGSKTMREQKALCKFWEENGLVEGVDAGIHSFARMFEDGGEEPARYMKSFIERKR